MSPTPAPGGDDWHAWSHFVLQELKRLSRDLSELEKQVTENNRRTCMDLAVLKVRSGLVGLVGGAIPAVVVLVYVLLNG